MGLFGIFGNKDKGESMTPANDTERWLVGTYAMWSESTGGKWGYIAGSPEKNKKEAASMRVMLRQEMTDSSVRVGRIMQKYYHSWGELYDSYLKGYAKWRREAGGEAEKDITAREELCRRLRDMPEGPCSVAWNLPLA